MSLEERLDEMRARLADRMEMTDADFAAAINALQAVLDLCDHLEHEEGLEVQADWFRTAVRDALGVTA